MNFLNNSWVIGIGGGILSGLVVTFISRVLFSKKDNREYIQNLRLANNEVIYALRPTISENYFPTIDVINALINANSRKFKVNNKDMYSVKQIAEELTKEIMDTSFISYQKKEDLFKHLIELYQSEIQDTKDGIIENREGIYDYKTRLLRRVTLMLGVTTSMTIMLLTFYEELIPNDLIYDNVLLSSLAPTLIISIILIVGVTFFMYERVITKTQDKKISEREIE